MSAKFVNIDRDTPMLLPPDLREWLPEEIARRKQRMARIREAVDVIEDREKEKADQERQRRKAKANGFEPQEALADTGYYSQSEVETLESNGVEAFVAVERQTHGRSLASILGEEEPPPPETPDPSPRQKMRNKLSTPQGRERYGLRKQTVEPVFGIIKEVMRFRQFLMRGQDEVAGEWNLVCCSYNLKRLFSLLGSRSLQLVAPAGRKTA